MPLPGIPPGGAPAADEQVWRLTKGRRVAVCWRRLHPLGLELRVDVNGDTMRTTVARTIEEARAECSRMYALMLDRGWQVAAQ